MKLTETIKDLQAIRSMIEAALADAKSAQVAVDESQACDSPVCPFELAEEDWKKEGASTRHLEALHLLDEARQHFHL